jgi:hypothetical protein
MKRATLTTLLMVCMLFWVAVLYLTDRVVHPPIAKASPPSTFANIACDQFTPISNLAASAQIITAGNANMFIYLCSYNLNAAAADVISIVEGTGTTCATNTKAMVGNTTAAGGLAFAANGNVNYGGGVGVVARTIVAGDNVCVLVTTAGPLAGVIGWTSAPY